MNWQAPDVILRAFLCMCIIVISISKIIVIQLEYWESDIHHGNLLMLWLNHLFLIYICSILCDLRFISYLYHIFYSNYFQWGDIDWTSDLLLLIRHCMHLLLTRVPVDRNTQCNKYLDCRILNKTMSIQCNTFCHKYIWKFSLAKI